VLVAKKANTEQAEARMWLLALRARPARTAGNKLPARLSFTRGTAAMMSQASWVKNVTCSVAHSSAAADLRAVSTINRKTAYRMHSGFRTHVDDRHRDAM
jgi:hypothetical protein